MTGSSLGEDGGPVTARSIGVGNIPAPVKPEAGDHDDLLNYRPGNDVRHHLTDAVLASHVERWAS